MNKKIFLDKILGYFVDESDIPGSLDEKIKLWEELVTTKEFKEVPEDILSYEDKFLRLELINRKLTDGEKLSTIDKTLNSNFKFKDKISLWKGDITTIYADLIVNPTSNNMLFRTDINGDNIDYDIFLRSGMRLVNKCIALMDKELDDSDILITRAYNLPCDYIVHVIVPEIKNRDEETERVLGMCYRNVLECAKNNMAKIVVTPCIGINSKLDVNKLVEIAVNAVTKFLEENNTSIEKIIFQVNNDDVYSAYKSYLVGDSDA